MTRKEYYCELTLHAAEAWRVEDVAKAKDLVWSQRIGTLADH